MKGENVVWRYIFRPRELRATSLNGDGLISFTRWRLLVVIVVVAAAAAAAAADDVAAT